MPIDLKATTAIPAGVRAALGLPVSAALYGAVGDGVTDDTAALQAGIDATVADGLHLFIPAGTYVISSALTITAGEGWTITGAGRDATIIEQATDNTPAFHFPNTGTARWEISHLRVTWSDQQVVASTSAIAFAFGNAGALPDGWGHWGFRIAHVNFSNGVYGVSQTNTAVVNPLWGCELDDLNFDETWVSAAIRLVQTGGAPGVTIRRVYVNAQDFDASTPYVFGFQGCRGMLLDNLEVNTCGLEQELYLETCTATVVRSYRTEGGTISDPWNGVITCAASDVTIDGFELLTKTVAVGGGNYGFALRVSTGSASRVRAKGIFAEDITLTSGAFHALNAAAGVIRYQDVTGFAEVIYPWDSSASRIVGFHGRDFIFGSGPRVTSGTGTPEGAVTAAVGSLYLRDDGGAGTSMYVKESGTGNTGWVGK